MQRAARPTLVVRACPHDALGPSHLCSVKHGVRWMSTCFSYPGTHKVESPSRPRERTRVRRQKRGGEITWLHYCLTRTMLWIHKPTSLRDVSQLICHMANGGVSIAQMGTTEACGHVPALDSLYWTTFRGSPVILCSSFLPIEAMFILFLGC